MKILIKAADFVVAFLLTIAASSMIISMFLHSIRLCIGRKSCPAIPLSILYS